VLTLQAHDKTLHTVCREHLKQAQHDHASSLHFALVLNLWFCKVLLVEIS